MNAYFFFNTGLLGTSFYNMNHCLFDYFSYRLLCSFKFTFLLYLHTPLPSLLRTVFTGRTLEHSLISIQYGKSIDIKSTICSCQETKRKDRTTFSRMGRVTDPLATEICLRIQVRQKRQPTVVLSKKYSNNPQKKPKKILHHTHNPLLLIKKNK